MLMAVCNGACTASASWSTPFSMSARASSPKRRSLPDMWRTAVRTGVVADLRAAAESSMGRHVLLALWTRKQEKGLRQSSLLHKKKKKLA